jgi:hypothetical protein
MKGVGVAALMALASATAAAGVTVTFGSTAAPTYATTLNFDEPGTPTGIVATTYWQSSHGIVLGAGVGDGAVGNFESVVDFEWLGDENVFEAPFGAFMNFDAPVTAFSAQVWDNAGPPDFISGGMVIFIASGGQELYFDIVTPTFSDFGPTWINIVADAGESFDDIRFVGQAFGAAFTYVDNMSWNAVPAPSSLALLAMGGLAARRRR